MDTDYTAIFDAYNDMHNCMTLDKFTAICEQLPILTPAAIADFIDGSDDTGWGSETDNAEHQVWLVTASARDIAEWINAGQ